MATKAAVLNQRIDRLRSSLRDIEADLTGKGYGEIANHIRESEIEKLWIRNKEGRHVRLALKEKQRAILEEFNKALSEGKPVREIVLKARKIGCSTLFAAICYVLMRDYHCKMTIVGQNLSAAKNLFKMIRLFHRKDMSFKELPEAKNTRELVFAEGGEVWVASADTEDASRSQTNQIVFATEVPFWPKADEQMLALLNTVAESKGTVVIIESTANGVGNWFHNTWLSATNQENEYIPIFVAWYDDEEYVRAFETFEARERFLLTLNEEEQSFFEEGRTPEQIHWWRHTLMNKCGGDIDKMHQEYPSTPSEAFLESGRPVFSQARLAAWYEDGKKNHPPIFEGEVQETSGCAWNMVGLDEKEREKGFRKQVGGQLRVWEWPVEWDEHGRRINYGMGMDIAEGKERSDGKGDESTIFVGKQYWSPDRRILEKVEIVLTWAGRIPPDQLAVIAKCIGKAYNEANICPEANSMGSTTIKVLWETYNTSRLYRRRGIKHIISETLRDSVGFWSDMSTKNPLMSQLGMFIRKNILVLWDLDAIHELTQIVHSKAGKIETNGRDRTTATALCVEACVYDNRILKREKEMDDFSKYKKWRDDMRKQGEMEKRYRQMLGRN